MAEYNDNVSKESKNEIDDNISKNKIESRTGAENQTDSNIDSKRGENENNTDSNEKLQESDSDSEDEEDGAVTDRKKHKKKLKEARVCRVFFSSPFRGMEAERELLTKQYFPTLQSLCNSHGVQFIPVDMRWGISHELSTNAKTIEICLREIDRSDIFVGFFGQVISIKYINHKHCNFLDKLVRNVICQADSV